MKLILPIVLALACAALLVALFLTKKNDRAQFDSDIAAFTDCSNMLVAVQGQVVNQNATITTFSNSLNDCQTALLTTSNSLVAAQSAVALDSDQITSLTQQVAQTQSDIQTLQAFGRQAMDQTNQLNGKIAALNTQLTLTESNLAAVQKDHLLLEDRLRQDVAERLIIARKFYNPQELQAQLAKLKDFGGSLDVTADKIYAGLDVEVSSNGTLHVLAPQ